MRRALARVVEATFVSLTSVLHAPGAFQIQYIFLLDVNRRCIFRAS